MELTLNRNRLYQIFSSNLLEWYVENGRKLPWRNSIDTYRVLVTEKLLQQTSYGHVIKVYEKFFKKYPTIESLAASESSEIEKDIKRLGLQRQRAIHLKKVAEKILKNYDGKVPNDRKLLLSLPGVGDYIADAVLCYAFGKNIVPVDINVRRVANRLFKFRKTLDYHKIQEKMNLLIQIGNAKYLNWALLDFSALICSRAPKCRKCFANNICKFYIENIAHE